MQATCTAANIDFAELAIELSELRRAIESFLCTLEEGQDPAPQHETLMRQLNSLADLYS